MNKVSLKTDVNGRALQSLTPVAASTNATIGAASVRSALPSESLVIRLAASGNCYIAFGNSTVVATTSSMLFPTGAEIFTLNTSWTHIAVIQEGTATGVLSITEMN